MLAAEKNTNIIISLISIVPIIVTILIFIIQSYREKKIKANKYFDTLYNSTFELREKISNYVGFDWYYEFCMTVIQNPEANESILLYLNNVNNMFYSTIESVITKYHLNRLIPIKLYNRLISLVSYIEYYRQVENNQEKFDNYTKFVAYCAKTKTIKKRYYKIKDFNWVGIRQSDIKDNRVKNNISIFYDNMTEKDVRPNQNLIDPTNFYKNELKKIKNNQKWAYIFKDVSKNYAKVNDNILLDFLNDKFMIREYMMEFGIKCFSSIIFENIDLEIEKLKDNIYSNAWVVQEINGSGGYGTWLLTEKNQKSVLPLLKSNFKRYIISKYYEQNIPVNVTVMVSEKQTVVFPASIQIIEIHNNQLMYRGNDFIAFRDLSDKLKESVLRTASNISNALRLKGYKGIAGIDLMIVDEDVYFCEVNPRFQASSPILSKYLLDKKITIQKKVKNRITNSHKYESFDLLKLNANAFEGVINTSVNFYDEINYSCYYYFKDKNDNQDINYKMKQLNKVVDNDGYTAFSKLDENSYLFRAILSKKICQISPDNTVWLSDNIRINKRPELKETLKIALLNQGVRVNSKVKAELKEAVFDAIDFYIVKDDMYINSPIDCPLVEYSPFSIEKIGEEYFLQFNGANYSKIIIEKNQIEDKINFSERNSLYLSTDRLRINPILGCDYKSIGKGCKFCDFPNKNKVFTKKELIDAYDYSRTNLNYSHILIGGGAVIDFKNEEIVLDLIRYIRNKEPQKGITLMSVPLPKHKLRLYKEAGITDVSFNIEIFDQGTAEKIMPAKSTFNREYYFNILKSSKEIWNHYGDVRTIIMVGFDRYENLLTNISYLNKIGVQPVLSVFRPLKYSELANNLPPTNEYLYKLYNDCLGIIAPNNLGPKCKLCKNNTLSL